MSEQLKKRLNRAVDALPQPSGAQIWETAVDPLETHDYITRQPSKLRKTAALRRSLAALACFALILLAGGGLWYEQALATFAIVDLDVNPSFEIEINRRETVLRVHALNDDAAALLEGRNYRGWDVADTVETLMISMGDGAYLVSGSENAVLISIRCADGAAADTLGQRLAERVRTTSDSEQTPTTVLRQSYEQTEPAPGKQRLIALLAQWLPERTPEELAAMTLEELTSLLLSSEGAGEVAVYQSNWWHDSDYGMTDYDDYDDTDYGPNNDGVTDYDDTDYGQASDGVTDYTSYGDTDYGPDADGVTDYADGDDTDYGPNADGVTDYDDTDYGPEADGVTDYTSYGDTDYGPGADGVTDFGPALSAVTDDDEPDDRPDDGALGVAGVTDYVDTDYSESDYLPADSPPADEQPAAPTGNVDDEPDGDDLDPAEGHEDEQPDEEEPNDDELPS